MFSKILWLVLTVQILICIFIKKFKKSLIFQGVAVTIIIRESICMRRGLLSD